MPPVLGLPARTQGEITLTTTGKGQPLEQQEVAWLAHLQHTSKDGSNPRQPPEEKNLNGERTNIVL